MQRHFYYLYGFANTGTARLFNNRSPFCECAVHVFERVSLVGEAKGTPAPLAASRPLITCHIPHSETIRIRVLRQANAHSVLRMDFSHYFSKTPRAIAIRKWANSVARSLKCQRIVSLSCNRPWTTSIWRVTRSDTSGMVLGGSMSASPLRLDVITPAWNLGVYVIIGWHREPCKTSYLVPPALIFGGCRAIPR